MTKHYREIAAVILTAAMMLSTGVIWAAEPQDIMNEPFDYAQGTDIKTQASPWKFDEGSDNPAKYTVTAAQDPVNAENTAMKIEVTEKGAEGGNKYSYLRYPFDTVSDTKCNLFSYRIYIPSDVEGYNTQATTVDKNGMLGAPVYFALNDALNQRTAPFYQTISIGTKDSGLNRLKMRGVINETTNTTKEVDFPLESDQWYTVSSIIDSTGKRIHMTVTNEQTGASQSEDLFYQRYLNALSTLTQLEIYPHFNFENVMLYLDDFKLEAYDYADTLAVDQQALEIEELPVNGIVSENFVLPEFGPIYKSILSWASNNPSVIRVENGQAIVQKGTVDTEVTLTATLSGAPEQTLTKNFVVTVPGAGIVGEAYQNLTLDKLTREYAQAITQSFSLDTSSFISGVAVTWMSSDPSVLTIDGANALVSRKDYDRPVILTAKISDGNEVMYKSFSLNVWAANPVTAITETFDYTDYIGKPVFEVAPLTENGWKLDYTSGSYYENSKTVLEADIDDGAGGLIKHTRTVADQSGKNNCVSWNLPQAQTGQTVVLQARINFDTQAPSRYNIEIMGGGTTVGGSASSGFLPVDLAFDYTTDRIWSTQCIDGKWQANNDLTTISRQLPELGVWFDLKVELNLTSQTFDVYIDGERINTASVPFRCSGDPTPANAAATVDNINLIRAYIFRGYGDGELLIDDVSLRGIEKESVVRSIQIVDVAFKDAQGGAAYGLTAKGTIDSIRILKHQDIDATVVTAIYQDGRLLDVFLYPVTESSTLSCGMKLPEDLAGVTAKIFVWTDTAASMMPLSDMMLLQ